MRWILRVVRKLPNGDLFGENCGYVIGLPKGGWCDQCKAPLLEYERASGEKYRVCTRCSLEIKRCDNGVWQVVHYGYHLRDYRLMTGSEPIEIGLTRKCEKCGKGFKDYYGEDLS